MNVTVKLDEREKEEIIEILNEIVKEAIRSELAKSRMRYQVQQEYINKKTTCEYLGITNNTLDKWMEDGLPYNRIGGTIRFCRHDLDDWMMKKRIKE